jgi:preprotein translocase subunit SecE
MAKLNPGQFRKETTVSTGMVFLMVFVAALFFFLIDQLLSNLVKLILSF